MLPCKPMQVDLILPRRTQEKKKNTGTGKVFFRHEIMLKSDYTVARDSNEKEGESVGAY